MLLSQGRPQVYRCSGFLSQKTTRVKSLSCKFLLGDQVSSNRNHSTIFQHPRVLPSWTGRRGMTRLPIQLRGVGKKRGCGSASVWLHKRKGVWTGPDLAAQDLGIWQHGTGGCSNCHYFPVNKFPDMWGLPRAGCHSFMGQELSTHALNILYDIIFFRKWRY